MTEQEFRKQMTALRRKRAKARAEVCLPHFEAALRELRLIDPEELDQGLKTVISSLDMTVVSLQTDLHWKE